MGSDRVFRAMGSDRVSS